MKKRGRETDVTFWAFEPSDIVLVFEIVGILIGVSIRKRFTL